MSRGKRKKHLQPSARSAPIYGQLLLAQCRLLSTKIEKLTGQRCNLLDTNSRKLAIDLLEKERNTNFALKNIYLKTQIELGKIRDAYNKDIERYEKKYKAARAARERMKRRAIVKILGFYILSPSDQFALDKYPVFLQTARKGYSDNCQLIAEANVYAKECQDKQELMEELIEEIVNLDFYKADA